MTEEELLKELAKIENYLDGIANNFVKELDKYEKNYEQLLYKTEFQTEKGRLLPSLQNYSKASNLSGFDLLGLQTLGAVFIAQYDAIATRQINFLKKLNIETNLTFTDLSIVQKLKEIDLGALYQKGKELDASIKKALINGIATGANNKKMISDIRSSFLGFGAKMGSLASYGTTYMRSSLFGVSRLIDKEIYDKVGGFNAYKYTGPIDKRTRRFCLNHVGKNYTIKEIDKFPQQNGSGLDPWFSPGGYNCRHRLIPTESIF